MKFKIGDKVKVPFASTNNWRGPDGLTTKGVIINLTLLNGKNIYQVEYKSNYGWFKENVVSLDFEEIRDYKLKELGL